MRMIRTAFSLLTAFCFAQWSLAEDVCNTSSFKLSAASGAPPYLIQVAIPVGPAPEAGYPVVYVLDAAHSFATVTDIVRLQELFFGPALVVGIRYEDPFEVDRRGFDFTPPPDQSWADEAEPGDVGGADAFITFILDKLKPAIAQRAKINPEKQALFGHSLGGLFALYVLLTRPQAFDTYVAASPSIQYGDSQILNKLAEIRKRGFPGMQRRLLITVGGLEDAPSPEELRFAKDRNIPIPPPSPPPAPGQDIVSRRSELVESLQSIVGLEASFAPFDGDTHNSSIPADLGRGVRWTLSVCNPP